MADKKQKDKPEEECAEKVEAASEEVQEESESQESAASQECELEKLNQELAEQKQQYLRVLAEYDNFRKRSQAEKDGVYRNAVSDTVNEILPIVDNIDRALELENASAEDMYTGVKMIKTQINSSLEKIGVGEIGAVGDTFDPNIHNAVSHIDDEAFGENVISAVYQKGYVLGDKVVRHAMVQVAN